MEFDVVILGGGSAGYAAASSAQSHGARVAIVDPGPLGGLCILRGCMPTKTILRSSDIISLMRRAKEFGLLPVETGADLAAINDRKNQLIGEFADYRIEQLKDPRFTLIQEKAEFISPNEVQVGASKVKAKSFIIATGSVIADYPIPGLQETGYVTSDDALTMREAPESIIVLGAGAVAVELAQFFLRIGTKVTLLQRSGHILSQGDEDLARPLEDRLCEEGMDLFTGTKIIKAAKENKRSAIYFEHDGKEKRVEAETILQALGRRNGFCFDTFFFSIVFEIDRRASISNTMEKKNVSKQKPFFRLWGEGQILMISICRLLRSKQIEVALSLIVKCAPTRKIFLP